MSEVKVFTGESTCRSLEKITLDSFEEETHNTNSVLNFHGSANIKTAMLFEMAQDYTWIYEDIINECLYGDDEENLEYISFSKIPKLIEILLEHKKRAENWYDAVEKIRKTELIELGVHEYCHTCERCKKFVEDNYTNKKRGFHE